MHPEDHWPGAHRGLRWKPAVPAPAAGFPVPVRRSASVLRSGESRHVSNQSRSGLDHTTMARVRVRINDLLDCISSQLQDRGAQAKLCCTKPLPQGGAKALRAALRSRIQQDRAEFCHQSPPAGRRPTPSQSQTSRP